MQKAGEVLAQLLPKIQRRVRRNAQGQWTEQRERAIQRRKLAATPEARRLERHLDRFMRLGELHGQAARPSDARAVTLLEALRLAGGSPAELELFGALLVARERGYLGLLCRHADLCKHAGCSPSTAQRARRALRASERLRSFARYRQLAPGEKLARGSGAEAVAETAHLLVLPAAVLEQLEPKRRRRDPKLEASFRSAWFTFMRRNGAGALWTWRELPRVRRRLERAAPPRRHDDPRLEKPRQIRRPSVFGPERSEETARECRPGVGAAAPPGTLLAPRASSERRRRSLASSPLAEPREPASPAPRVKRPPPSATSPAPWPLPGAADERQSPEAERSAIQTGELPPKPHPGRLCICAACLAWARALVPS